MPKREVPGLIDVPGKDELYPNRRDQSSGRIAGHMAGGTRSVMNFGTASEQAYCRPVDASPTRTTTATSGTKPAIQPANTKQPGYNPAIP